MRGSELVVIGADDAATAAVEAERVRRFIAAAPAATLRDIAFTCATEARGRQYRLAIVATSAQDLFEKLGHAISRLDSGMVRNSFNRGIYIGTEQCPAPGRTVFMFPGEGTQYPDMLRELALHFPACRAAFDAADTAVASAAADMGEPVWPPPSHYVFPPSPATANSSADIRSLPTPMAIQTVIAADTALLFLFRQLGIAPDAAMGVGVGELVALECAGAVRLPEKRNRIMMLGAGYKMISEINSARKSVPDCTTLSVAGLLREAVAEIIAPFGGAAAIAADQAPELLTIAVTDPALRDVESALSAAGAAIHPLPALAKPFHTAMMEPFSGHFRKYYGDFVSAMPEIPVYSCSTQQPIVGATPADIAEVAAGQWSNPISVGKTIRRLYDDGFRVFVELGARGGLTACVGSTLKRLPHLAVASNRGHRPDFLQLHHALAALASHGANFDATILHRDRGSLLLDLDRPSDYRPPKRLQERPIPHSMASMAEVHIPKGLIAAAPSTAAPPAGRGGDTPSSTDFPCLDLAEVVRFAPGDSIDLSLRLSTADFPYLAARAISAGCVSAYDKKAFGFIPRPAGLLAEIMAEAARRICPGKILVKIENLTTPLEVRQVERSGQTFRIQARRTSATARADTVEAAIFEAESFRDDAPVLAASCSIVMAGEYPEPPAPTPLSLRNSIRTDWTHEDIYSARIAAGECCRSIKEIPEIGDNGLTADCFMPPRSGIVRSQGQPHFSTPPACLSAASDALALLHCREPASGTLDILAGAGKIEFFAPPPAEWARFTTRIFTSTPRTQDTFASADAEFADDDHRIFMRVSGLQNRLVRISPQLHRLILDPIGASMSDEIPRESLPALPHEVVCSKVDDDWPDDSDEPLRLQIAASLVLSRTEVEKWQSLPSSRTRRHEWLFGRIAAKDSVRRCLLARYGRAIGASDILIESDEAGKPFPQGLWRKTCGARMDISITHTPGCIVAAAAPNASIGIDAENGNRSLSEDFASFAFSQVEREMAAESGDGATTLLRFWCAKEALSKSLGSGLRFGPNDLSAASFDPTAGKVSMAATRLWLEAFPSLKGILIPVQTCRVGGLVLAVCALNRELTEGDK